MAKEKGAPKRTRQVGQQEEALKRLKLLQEVRADIDTTMNLNQVLPKVLDTGLRVVGVQTGSIMLLNQDGELEFKARRQGPASLPQEKKHRSFQVGEGIAGWVALQGQPAHVPDVTLDKRFVPPKPGGALLFRSLLSVPISPADTAIGVINADHPAPGRFTEADLRLLSDLADQVLIAIGRAGLVDASQALQQAATTIERPTLPAFLEEVAHITRCLLYVPVCVIRLFDDNQQLKVAAAAGLTDRQMAVVKGFGLGHRPFDSLGSERLVYIDRAERATTASRGSQAKLIAELGLASGLIVVMRIKGQAIGTIEALTRVPRQFALWEKDLFCVFSDQAAVLIQNEELLEEEKSRGRALESLHGVGQSLTRLTIEQGQLESILQEIANQALTVSGAEIVTLYQYYESRTKFVTPPTIGGKENLRFGPPMTTEIYDDDVVARIAHLGESLWAPDAQTAALMYGTGIREPKVPGEETRPRFVIREQIESSVGIPLKVGHEVVGVMFFNYRKPQRFLEDYRRLLDTFANSAAIAIQNARQYDALRIAQAQASQAREHAWKEFSAMTAHRMGTEAADIAGALHWLKPALGPAAENMEAKQYLSRIEGALTRMNNVVTQFTEFAKPPELKLEPVNVNELLQEARSTVSMAGAEKVQVDMELADDLPGMRGDREKLVYSFKEMFHNAIKAMPQGGRLRVATQIIGQGDRISIEFHDTGSGVAPEHKERIFVPGVRVRPGGTGLGLAIIRQTIQEHGGRITEVGTLGQGAHFVIELPAGMSAGETEQTMTAQILVVEDTEHFRYDLERILGSPHRRVFTAKNEFEAEQLLAEASFDLVITDIKLDEAGGTETGGLQVLRVVRAKDQTIPVIVVTAFGKKEVPADERPDAVITSVEEMVKQMGAFAYVQRPHPARDYLEVIAETVALALEKR